MKIATNTELKPCPFCDGEAALIGDPFGYVVRCTRCGAETREVETCRGLYAMHHVIINEVVELWNRRVGESK